MKDLRDSVRSIFIRMVLGETVSDYMMKVATIPIEDIENILAIRQSRNFVAILSLSRKPEAGEIFVLFPDGKVGTATTIDGNPDKVTVVMDGDRTTFSGMISGEAMAKIDPIFYSGPGEPSKSADRDPVARAIESGESPVISFVGTDDEGWNRLENPLFVRPEKRLSISECENKPMADRDIVPHMPYDFP